jgi:hypothetical protein
MRGHEEAMGNRRDRFSALYEENYHRILGYSTYLTTGIVKSLHAKP